jgi:hypothetical protein
MPQLYDEIDIPAAEEFLGWWDRQNTVQRAMILSRIKGFLKWVKEVHAIVMLDRRTRWHQHK